MENRQGNCRASGRAFTFMVGPPDGWAQRRVRRRSRPACRDLPSDRQDVVLLPSPSGVGVMAVTSIYLPSRLVLETVLDLQEIDLGTGGPWAEHLVPFCRPSFSRHCSGVGMFFSASSETCQSAILVAFICHGNLSLL